MADLETLEAQPTVKCRITRADYPDDTSDIFAGLNGKGYTVQAGKTVELPKDIYLIFKNATRPVDIKEEDERTGQMRTKVIEAPRFAIIVDGVEDAATANSRISALAKESAAKVDSLTSENETLKARIAELEAVNAVSKK